MNEVEDRLKDAYAAAADTVSSGNIRQLDEQSVVITWPASQPARRARRWAIPVTTVAAALAVIAAIALPSYPTSGHGNRKVALNPLGERFVGALTPGSAKFVILNLSTGAKTATVTLPEPQDLFKAAATGDGVQYVVSVVKKRTCGTRLYQFRLNSAGTPSKLTPFDGGQIHQIVGQLQLSADGHTFAYLARPCGAARADLNVVNLTSGQHRQWSLPRKAKVNGLSLSGNGKKLTFSAGPINGIESAVYLLDTASPAGPVGQRSRILVKGGHFGPGYEVQEPRISLDGRMVYFTSEYPSISNPAEQARSVDTRTGHLKRIANPGGFFFTFVTDPSVHRAISIFFADLIGPFAKALNLRTGKFTKLKPSFYVPESGYYIW